MSTPNIDDLDAVRTIVDTLKGFATEDQQRILRWVAEKFNFPQLPQSLSQTTPLSPRPGSESSPAMNRYPGAQAPGAAIDIKTFVAEKKPRNDVQFAATVAYYYRFESPLRSGKR